MRYWHPSIPSRIRGDCPASGTTSDASNGPSLDKSGPIASGTPPAGITGEVNGIVLVAVTVSGVTAGVLVSGPIGEAVDVLRQELTGLPQQTVGSFPP